MLHADESECDDAREFDITTTPTPTITYEMNESRAARRAYSHAD